MMIYGDSLLVVSLVFTLYSAVNAAANPGLMKRDVAAVCIEIAQAISSASEVFYPPEYYYLEDTLHYISSSSQVATCSVEPGTTADVGAILQILGSTQTPFAVKGGGHASNPGFSSTTGVQIAMARFNGVTYDSTTQTAEIGTGLIWDDVYAALEPFGVNVVGGRVTGVGVAGFTLGGGFSFLTNQYGLTIDSMVSYDLVLPNGTATTVTASSNPDLFWALKGGFNNFGIVTQFTLKAYPQGEVWGGIILTSEIDQVETATANFYANVTDPKASIISTFNYDLGLTIAEINIFYDAPAQPDGIFDEFLAIPALLQDISTRSFLSLVLSAPSNVTTGLRGYFDTVSLYEITPSIMEAIVNETEFWSSNLALEVPGLFVSYDVEPFLPNAFSYGSDSAWPPTRTQTVLPLNIYYGWGLEASDSLINQVMQESASYLAQLAGVASAALYPNYAIYDTPLANMYGDNVAMLQEIKTQYDPDNVMNLAGGWKF